MVEVFCKEKTISDDNEMQEVVEEYKLEDWGLDEDWPSFEFWNLYKTSIEDGCRRVYDDMVQRLESKEFQDWVKQKVL